MNKLITSVLACLLVTSATLANEAELKSQIDKLRTQNESIEQQLQQLLTQTKNLTEQSKTNESTNAVIGGYGEIVYNNYSKDSSRNQMDLKRFVLSVNKTFNEKLSFNGEVEWEHAIASSGDQGETAIEQAYVNYQFSQSLNLKVGLFLMPFGFLNESHEPPVFYGVERNEVETRIIPSTWREGGISLSGMSDSNLDWSLGIVTGFDVAKFDEQGEPLGAIHQELQFAKAHDLSYFATLNYKIPGLVAGVGVFTGKTVQGDADFNADATKPSFAGISGLVTLTDAHVRYQQNGWDAQALLVKGTLGDADQIDNVIQTYNTANTTSLPFVAFEFYGWLVQTAYVFSLSHDASFAPFVRFEEFNTQAKVPVGFSASSTNADHVATVGVSYKPVAQVVFKADYQNYNDNSASNRFNLGMGYMF